MLDQSFSQRREHRANRIAVLDPVLCGFTPARKRGVFRICHAYNLVNPVNPVNPLISSRMKSFTPSRPLKRSQTGPPAASTSTANRKNGQQSLSNDTNSLNFVSNAGLSASRNSYPSGSSRNSSILENSSRLLATCNGL